MLMDEQTVGGEIRHVFYGESDAGRLLAMVVAERQGMIRVVTAYTLDAGQKRGESLRSKALGTRRC